jgi:polyhydroxyalkanoate synthase
MAAEGVAMSKASGDRSSEKGPDFDKLAENTGRLMEEAGKVAAAYIRPREDGTTATIDADEASDMVKTLGRIAESWVSSPQRVVEAQTALAGSMLQLWTNSLRRMQGEAAEPVAAVNPRDKRFSDPDWSENP